MNPTLTREQIESLLKRGKEAIPLIDPPHMLLNDELIDSFRVDIANHYEPLCRMALASLDRQPTVSEREVAKPLGWEDVCGYCRGYEECDHCTCQDKVPESAPNAPKPAQSDTAGTEWLPDGLLSASVRAGHMAGTSNAERESYLRAYDSAWRAALAASRKGGEA